MRRMALVVAGGIAMASIMGVLLIWWLSLDQGSGFVGFLFIAGMLVGIAVFAGGAAEAAADLRLEDRQLPTRSSLPNGAGREHNEVGAVEAGDAWYGN
jgi:hypothetical protein